MYYVLVLTVCYQHDLSPVDTQYYVRCSVDYNDLITLIFLTSSLMLVKLLLFKCEQHRLTMQFFTRYRLPTISLLVCGESVCVYNEIAGGKEMKCEGKMG